MSEEWKIVQGLKRQVQNDSFDRNTYREIGERRERKMTKEEEARYLLDIAMKELPSNEFFERDEENERLRINQLKTYIKDHKEDEEDIKMRIGEMNIVINKNQPTKINFVSYGNIDGKNGTVLKYPYRITIYGGEIYSEVDMIQQSALASYKESGEDSTKLAISRTITVVNSEEINEYIDLKGQNSEEVIEDLIKRNSEYLKGEEGSIYRSEINPDDEIRKMSELGIYYKKIDRKTPIVEFPSGFGIESTEFIDAINKGEDINVEEKNNNPKRYEEGIKISREIEEHCKYVYYILIEAEKGILEQSKTNESRNGTYYDYDGFDANGYNRRGYDRYGYDRDGYNRDGYDRDGYGRDGFNKEGIHRNGRHYDDNGFDVNGYDRYGYDRDGYDRDGYNRDGYGRDGYDKDGVNRGGFNKEGIHRNGTYYDDNGFDVNGYDRDGYDRDGYDKRGYDIRGYDRYGYDRDGYNRDGYDRDGYGRDGFNKEGIHRNGRHYDDNGFDVNGYDRYGYDRDGYDRDGYNRDGYGRDGYDKDGVNRGGFNKEGIHRNGTYYDDDGFDVNGYNRSGFDRYGYDRDGYDKEGYDRDSYDRDGYNYRGFDKKGIHRETVTIYDEKGFRKGGRHENGTRYDDDGYDFRGFDRDGYNREGINKNGLTRNQIKEAKNQRTSNYLGLINKAEKLGKGEMSLEDYVKSSKTSIEELIKFAKKENMSADIVRGLQKYKKSYAIYKKPFSKKNYLESTILLIDGQEVKPTEEDVDKCVRYLKANDSLICDKTVKDTVRKYLRGEMEVSIKDEEQHENYKESKTNITEYESEIKQDLVEIIVGQQKKIKAQEVEIADLKSHNKGEV